MKRIVLLLSAKRPGLRSGSLGAGEWNSWPAPALAHADGTAAAGRTRRATGTGARCTIRSRVTKDSADETAASGENRYNTALPASPGLRDVPPRRFVHDLQHDEPRLPFPEDSRLRSSRMQPDKAADRSMPDRERPRGHPPRNRCRAVFTIRVVQTILTPSRRT